MEKSRTHVVASLLLVFTFTFGIFGQRLNSELGPFFSVTFDGQTGLVDRNGRIVIKPRFSAIGEFETDCDCFWAMNGEKMWGTIDLQGRWVVEPVYSSVSGSGEYKVVKQKNNLKKSRFVDNFGNYHFQEFDAAKPFSGGLAAVRIGAKWGFINRTGEVAVPLIYNANPRLPLSFSVGDFSDGLAGVNLGERSLYITRDNKIAFELPPGVQGGTFHNGRAIIERSGKDGIIDGNGRIVLEPTFNEIKEFSEYFAAFRSGVSWGYLDQYGKIAIGPKFESASAFSCGLAAVRINGKYGYINTTGAWRIEPKLDEAADFWKGLAQAELNGKSVLINKNGSPVIFLENLGKNWP